MADLPLSVWAGFLGLIGILLALDLGVFHRRAHRPTLRESIRWTAVWIGAGLAFTLVIHRLYLPQGDVAASKAVETYLTAYLLEKALSVDNLFVFVILFGFFAVPPEHRHKVLFWGILGALALRGAFIISGAALIHAYEPVLYVFAGVLLFTAAKLALSDEGKLDPAQSRVYRFLRRVLPLSGEPAGGVFFRVEAGKRVGTTLLLCLLMVEVTDVVFAIDSVPAAFGVTQDAFVIYTSNVFAILGLRSIYFVVEAGLAGLRFLKPALVGILAFIGVKMFLSGPWWHVIEIPPLASLGVVGSILGVATVASLVGPKRRQDDA